MRARTYTDPCGSLSQPCGRFFMMAAIRSSVAFIRAALIGLRAAVIHALDQMRARGTGLKAVGKILRFTGHAPVAEFHDADRIGRHAVVGEREFSDPKVAAAA